MPAFTRALYYPWMDFSDEGWLKNALLYWDGVQTIVPRSIKRPYESNVALEFQDNGLLEPLYVESKMEEIDALTGDILAYMNSAEGADVLTSSDSDYRSLHPDKLPKEINRLVRLHPQKLPNEVHYLVKKIATDSQDEWLRVDQRFANFYMTLLATRLSQTRGLGLLTPSMASDRLANASRLGAQYNILNLSENRPGYPLGPFDLDTQPHTLAQGALADLILKGIDIDPETPVKKILEFKKRHSDELGLLRTKVGDLTGAISQDQPLESLLQGVNDTYKNEFVPQLNAFKSALTSSKIKWVGENLLKVSFFSTSATSIPLALLGVSIPHALLVGLGISLTVSAVLYNYERLDKLATSPFSYVMAAEKQLQ